MSFSRIIGTGSYLPDRVVTNHDLEKVVDTNDEWIVSRTGIRERHYAADDQNASDLALEACKRALHAAHVHASEIDLIIVATSTPDMVFPSTACILRTNWESSTVLHSISRRSVQALCLVWRRQTSSFAAGRTSARSWLAPRYFRAS